MQEFNTKSNESSLAFEEHAVAREFTPAFTLTDEFTSAVRLTALGDDVSDVLRNITNARGDKKKVRKGVCKFILAYPRKMSTTPHL